MESRKNLEVTFQSLPDTPRTLYMSLNNPFLFLLLPTQELRSVAGLFNIPVTVPADCDQQASVHTLNHCKVL